MDGKKFCPDCGETKPITDFHTRTGAIRHAQCASCVGIRIRMRTYNLDRDTVIEMMNRGCDVCGAQPEKVKEIHIDHCHDSGKVRGVLCNACNTTLGLVKENADVLRALIAYIERHQPTA